MREVVALIAAAFVLTGCSGSGAQHHAQRSASDDLSAIQATSTPAFNGSGAPIDALVVSGTITNTSSTPLRCRATAFLLVEENGNAFAPSSQWCDVLLIGPSHSAGFSATFRAPQAPHLQLRFVHPDGTYEAHSLHFPQS